jgi:hypothetical protein
VKGDVPPPKEEVVERVADWPLSIVVGETDMVGALISGRYVAGIVVSPDKKPPVAEQVPTSPNIDWQT